MIPMAMVHAQREAGTYSLGGFGGVGRIMGPEAYKDWTKMGTGFGGEFKFNMTEMTSLGISYTNLSFPMDTEKVQKDLESIFEGVTVEIDPFSLKAGIISANLIQYFTAPGASAGFYGTIGVGYYMLTTEDSKMTITVPGLPQEEEKMEGGDPENKLGINGGLGLEVVLGEMIGLFVEGKYHYILSGLEEDEETQEMEEALGKSMSGKITFIGIMGGLIISL
jgi:hypothetical protein